MFRASLGLLAALPVWSAACAVYDPSLFDKSGSGGAAGSVSGTSGSNGGTSTGAGAANGGGNSPGGAFGGTGFGGDGPFGTGGSSYAGTSSGSGSGGTSPLPIGGSGGTTGGGGSSGTSGVLGPVDLVDDFETADTYGNLQDGRVPLWYLFNDATIGTQLPDPLEMTAVPVEDAAARPGSVYALFTSSSGFSSWGSGVGVDLCNDTAKTTYDATEYAGISFYAKAPSAYQVIRVNVADVGTDPSGAICNPDMGECSDHFGQMVTLSADWQRYDLYFADMQQVGWGLTRDSLSVSELYSVQFQIAATKSVELWLDDLSLIRK